MATVYRDRVLETSTSTGTGAFTLAGAVTGHRAFSSVMSSSAPADTCYYAIWGVDSSGTPTGEYEAGFGTYSGANTLTRTRPDDGSSGLATAVTFSAGTKYVALSLNVRESKWVTAAPLASDYTNSTTTLSDITGATFDAEASAVYEIEVQGDLQSAATTTGLGLALTVPTGSTVTGHWWHEATTTQTMTVGWQNASATVGAKTSGVPATATSYPFTGKFRVTTSTTAGAIKLQGASEVAASQVTIKAGMIYKARRVS